LLDRYYADTPWVHRLRVPQGSYEVVVQHRVAPPTRSADGAGVGGDVKAAVSGDQAGVPLAPGAAPSGAAPRYGRWFVAILLLALALFALSALRSGPDRLFVGAPVAMPLLEVSPPVSGNTPPSRALARALDSKLRDGLRRFDMVDLMSAPAPGTAAARAADYRLDVSMVLNQQGVGQVTLVLNRVADQRAIWSQQEEITDDGMPRLAPIEPLIAQIAADYGVIVRDQVQRQPENFAAGYPCLAQFNRMRQMRNTPYARQVEACLRATLKRDERNPVALAALSLLRFGDWQPQRARRAGL
jgi:hypothetical protein